MATTAAETIPISPIGPTSSQSQEAPAAAVELDSSPIAPAAPAQLGSLRKPPRRSSSAEPGADVAEYEEISGEVGAGSLRAEERAKIRAEKSQDPAVMVNIPQTPDAQDYEVVSIKGEQSDRSSAEGVTQSPTAVTEDGK
ncbi:MAG: hypothetical protein M1825_001808 [Sarcosagium campestre]|nr:MAG: hypothetical protein M1825_001808 [Sarcosagium campestre]